MFLPLRRSQIDTRYIWIGKPSKKLFYHLCCDRKVLFEAEGGFKTVSKNIANFSMSHLPRFCPLLRRSIAGSKRDLIFQRHDYTSSSIIRFAIGVPGHPLVGPGGRSIC
jgi:hypothetical protein